MKQRWLQAIKNWFVADVPEDIGLCEFDCRKLDCREDEWATCERRLAHQERHESPALRQK